MISFRNQGMESLPSHYKKLMTGHTIASDPGHQTPNPSELITTGPCSAADIDIWESLFAASPPAVPSEPRYWHCPDDRESPPKDLNAAHRWKTCGAAQDRASTRRKRKFGHINSQAACSMDHVNLDTEVSLPELRRKFNLNDSVLVDIINMARNFIRPDLITYLQEAFLRWKEPGLWAQEHLPEPLVSGPRSEKLRLAYQYICGLEERIRDDQIRSRIALVLLHTGYEQGCNEWQHYRSGTSKQRGRGDASAVIDDILASVHPEWQDPGVRKALRSRFHDKKRYGKRWLLLAEPLGAGVLLACSSKVAAMM
jgi:hypothetical protein